MTNDDGGKRRPREEATSATSRFAQRSLDIDLRGAPPEVELKAWTAYPLLYRKRIAKVDSATRPGDLVAIYAPSPVYNDKPERTDEADDSAPVVPSKGAPDKLLGFGFFNPKSEILVRIVRHGEAPPDAEFFGGLLSRAAELRRDVLRLDSVTTAYRVVHAEADGFSGLVIDRYGDVLSAEAFSLGMYLRASAFLDRLARDLGTKHTIVKPSPHFLAQEGYEVPVVQSDSAPQKITIEEHGSRFRIRFEGGHKTGFFCDQRDNRKMLASFVKDKTVLDLCCYSGGFSIQAKKLGGASEVTGVDLDEEPLLLARENANLNQVRINFVQADAFTYMRDRLLHGHRFDVVVLDPPKLIHNRLEVDEGRKKYFDLNRLAMQLVKPGGLFLTCSCSGLMPEEEFTKLVFQASRQAGEELPEKTATGRPRHAARPIQILAKTGAAPDHPVSPYVPETQYLKAVWARL